MHQNHTHIVIYPPPLSTLSFSLDPKASTVPITQRQPPRAARRANHQVLHSTCPEPSTAQYMPPQFKEPSTAYYLVIGDTWISIYIYLWFGDKRWIICIYISIWFGDWHTIYIHAYVHKYLHILLVRWQGYAFALYPYHSSTFTTIVRIRLASLGDNILCVFYALPLRSHGILIQMPYMRFMGCFICFY